MDAGAEEDEGLLTQAEDDDNASGYFSRWKAYLPLSTDGTLKITHPAQKSKGGSGGKMVNVVGGPLAWCAPFLPGAPILAYGRSAARIR